MSILKIVRLLILTFLGVVFGAGSVFSQMAGQPKNSYVSGSNWYCIKGYKKSLNSIWVNQMFQHEYNPVHVHQGTLYTGLSSVMILKLPESFGVEYSSEQNPMNGKLQIMGSVSGQFATCDYSPNIKERDFYIFPYDVRHCVYPFNGNGFRRTLSANMDVEYNPIMNRGRD